MGFQPVSVWPLNMHSKWTITKHFSYLLLHEHFFDPEDNFETYRRNLPHRRQAGAIYFVTFHLADSLPTKKLVALEKEKKLWLALNPPPHNPRQIEEYHRNFSQRIQKWLDAGYGSCALARPQVFRLVASVLNFFNAQRYELGEYVVMPNHVHAPVEPLNDHSLENILHSWKSFSANQINKISGSHGRVWHQESFNYIVRSPAQLERFEQYIRNNPSSLPFSKGEDKK
jgi:REP element-mobilizing transposase RayT